jgi:acetyltransferase
MAGLKIPQISDKAKAVLKETMFPAASISNPIDVVATAGAPQFRSAIDVMMDEEHIDSVYINFVTPPFVDCVSVAREFVEVNKQKRKPIVCNYMTDKSQWIETTKILRKGGIPCYDFPGTAAKALAALTDYSEFLSKDTGSAKCFDDVDKAKVDKIIKNSRSVGRELLTSSQVYHILESYRIPSAEWNVTEDADQAVEAAEKIGYPVVVKADSEKISHKSDLGGVVVNITNADELRKVIENMNNRIAIPGMRFFIQEFIPGGTELIIGANEERGFGHLIMFGIGGIYVEVLKDVVFNLTPVTQTEAEEMLSSIKAAPILNGVRGKKRVYKKGIVEIIQRISQLVTDFPEIKELDLNPLMAFEDKIVVVDARISI